MIRRGSGPTSQEVADDPVRCRAILGQWSFHARYVFNHGAAGYRSFGDPKPITDLRCHTASGINNLDDGVLYFEPR